WSSPGVRGTDVGKSNCVTVPSVPNGTRTGVLVPRIGPSIVIWRIRTTRVAGNGRLDSVFATTSQTALRLVSDGVNDWPIGERKRRLQPLLLLRTFCWSTTNDSAAAGEGASSATRPSASSDMKTQSRATGDMGRLLV